MAKITTFAKYETIQGIDIGREYAVHVGMDSHIPYSLYECAVDVRAYG